MKDFEAVRVNGDNVKINTIYIQNFDTYVPEVYVKEHDVSQDLLIQKDQYGLGSHFQLHVLTPEFIKKMHEAGKIVAVWHDNDAPYKQDADYYKRLIELGIDMLTTDWPQEADEAL